MTKITYNIGDKGWKKHFPHFKKYIGQAVNETLNQMDIKIDEDIVVSILLTSNNEIKKLNNQYRKKNEPTNVLSFLINDNPLLGDIILCHSVIKKEALAQKKSIDDHYAHLVIHGYLHLIGFDHTKNDDELTMENKEIAVLKKLGIKNPYLSNIME